MGKKLSADYFFAFFLKHLKLFFQKVQCYTLVTDEVNI